MRKGRCFLLFIVCVSLFFCAISCSTTKTTTEYIEVHPDLTNVVDPVLMQRPDNSVLKIHPGPIFDIMDVIENSEQYLFAWEMWENYANALEQTLIAIRDGV